MKQNLIFGFPFLNAAGSLGFAPDFHAPLNWDEFGAFITNPISLRPRLPAVAPQIFPLPGGFLLHSGLPNPGFSAALKLYAARWQRARLPVIVHLMADRPEEAARMVRALENLENILAVELGFAPRLADDIPVLAVEMCRGELPLIVALPEEQIFTAGRRCLEAGASALSLAAPRGAIALENGDQVSGRLFGPALFARSLLTVREAARAALPLIGAGGVYSKENASAMLAAGALAVQVDAVLWRGGF
ncbi:hypothetical protein GW781_07830 [bacterium]|nr:hypothetical protein [bacterium]NCT21049.1 hypothetical protein [bacterium]